MSEKAERRETEHQQKEEYEDDFERDLDWLIDEESRSEEQEPYDEDIDAHIDKELEEEEHSDKPDENNTENKELPMMPPDHVFEFNGDDSHTFLPTSSPASYQSEDEKEKKYILEKIQQANQELQDQSLPEQTRPRRLQFKDTLVDLVVPPLEYEQDGMRNVDHEVSNRMAQLQISEEPVRGGHILVEKDGKFDLISLVEVESQNLLPSLASSSGEHHSTHGLSSPHNVSSPRTGSSADKLVPTPRPPRSPKTRPNSANQSLHNGGKRGTKRRVQSASSTLSRSTFTLSAQQKEIQNKIQQRRERLQKKDEERKRQEEAQKRQESERAFQAWLLKKREQLQEEQRIHKAQMMERINSKTEHSDPQLAYELWLQRKQEQQVRERHLEEMKKLEEESGHYMHSHEECEKAFKFWLKRKQAEKHAERHAARERTRRLVMEARRAHRMQDLLSSVSQARCLQATSRY